MWKGPKERAISQVANIDANKEREKEDKEKAERQANILAALNARPRGQKPEDGPNDHEYLAGAPTSYGPGESEGKSP